MKTYIFSFSFQDGEERKYGSVSNGALNTKLRESSDYNELYNHCVLKDTFLTLNTNHVIAIP